MKPEIASDVDARAGTFYCVTDRHHFLGAVALLNSLRLVGHDEPFVVLDCGLESRQRRLIAQHAIVLPGIPGVSPMLQKPVAPLARPARVMALLDSDVIVTRSLVPLLQEAAAGKIVAFANDQGRFFAEWAELTGTSPRKQRYVASGHLFLSGARGERLLRLLAGGQARIDLRQTLLGLGSPSDPYYFPDMDVLNAVLASNFDAHELAAIDQRLAPFAPFSGVELVDDRALTCRTADGDEPYVLHHVLAKPWLRATKSNIYSRLLTRVLLEPDVELRLSPRDLPLRLRQGRLAAGARACADIRAATRPYVRGRLGIRRRLEARRRAAARRGPLSLPPSG